MVSMTRLCGSFTGRRRRRTWFSSVKMAVFAPMPSASVSTATRVNPGVRRKVRRAKFRSRRNVRHKLTRFMKTPVQKIARQRRGVGAGRRVNHQWTETELATSQDDGGVKWSCREFIDIENSQIQDARAKGSTRSGQTMFR